MGSRSIIRRSAAAIAAVALACSALLAGGAAAHAAEGDGPYARWAWFEDTYWIVPQAGIYSVMHTLDPQVFAVTRGQTVFHIQDYFNGYWLGTVVVKLSKAEQVTCQWVLGQVTPRGDVYMTMYDPTTGAVKNNPVGRMEKQRGEWTMVNQMTAPTKGGGTLSHWAYMVQSAPGDRTYESLPFVQESIPDFMSSCPAAPPLRRV